MTSGYRWSDNATGTKTFSCSISKATPTITLSATSGTVVKGKTLTFTEKANVAGKFTNSSSSTSVATVSPTSNSSAVSANTAQTVTVTGAGSGTATITINFTPSDTSNYNNASAKTYTATITNSATIPTNSLCASRTYTGSAQTLVSSTSGTGYTLSGYSQTNAGTYTITATLSSGYRWSDNATGTKTFTCSISKATPSVSITSKTVTYTGSAISANSASVSPNAGGSISYTYYTNSSCSSTTTTSYGASSSGGAPADAGTYYVKATVASTSNTNSASSSCTIHVISKKSVTVSWGSTTSWSYNGSSHVPTASASTGISSESMSISVSGAQTNAGSYTATASCSSVSGNRAKCSNYSLSSYTKSYSITKISNTLSVSGKTSTYNGSYLALVTAYNAQGTVYYAVGTQLTSSNYSSSGSTSIPTRIYAGSYTVYYYTPGNNNYNATSGSVTGKINSVYPSLSVTLKPDSASSTFTVSSTGASYKCTSSGCSSCSGSTCTTFSSSDWIDSMSFSWTNTGYSSGTVFAWNASGNYTGTFNSSIDSSTPYTATTNTRSINSGGKRLITITNNGTSASGGLTTKVYIYFAVNGDGYVDGSLPDGWHYSSDGYWYYRRSGSDLKGSTASNTVSAFWLTFDSDTQYYSFDTSGRNVYAWLKSSNSYYVGYSKMAAAISTYSYGDIANRMYYGTKQPIYFTNGSVRNTTGASSSKLMGLVITPSSGVYYPGSIYSACTNIAFSSISDSYFSCWYDKVDNSTSDNDTSYTCE